MKHIDANKFWLNEETIVAIDDLPEAISNGFLMDFRAKDIWEALDFEPSITKDTLTFGFTGCVDELIFESEGRSLAHNNRKCFTLFTYQYQTPSGQVCRVQKQYAEYFTRRYPGCSFWFEGINMAIAVKLDSEIVAALMPIVSTAGYKVLATAEVK